MQFILNALSPEPSVSASASNTPDHKNCKAAHQGPCATQASLSCRICSTAVTGHRGLSISAKGELSARPTNVIRPKWCCPSSQRQEPKQQKTYPGMLRPTQRSHLARRTGPHPHRRVSDERRRGIGVGATVLHPALARLHTCAVLSDVGDAVDAAHNVARQLRHEGHVAVRYDGDGPVVSGDRVVVAHYGGGLG